MIQADRVHSTPRKTATKIQAAKPITLEEPSRDLAYRRLESRVNDLDRLCEITLDLIHQWLENPKDGRRASHAVTIAEITQDRMREFKTTCYDWYRSPLRDSDDYVAIPMVSQR